MGRRTMDGTAGTQLTLEDAAALGSGASFWTSKNLAGAATFTLTDGPHGVRKQNDAADHLGISPSEPATCVPPAVSLAQSWDPELVHRVGELLGREARANQVGVLLGPGINIKRDPRGGRNFEYLSEDPFLTATLAEAWVNGVQGQGVGASLKHFAANNAEDDRMRASSDVDARTLREIYLRAFQRVVQRAEPWTVMCSYNRINGVFAAENRWLLTKVLREEWGFTGVVVSDWGAVRDRVAAAAAGLDLAMPGPDPVGDAEVVDAVTTGRLDVAVVRASASRVAALADAITATGAAELGFDQDAHHALAREAAARCIVLLKNESGTLPLAKSASVAVIGEFAARPRFQGGGSSHVVPTRVDIPLDEIRSLARGAVTYSRGFSLDGSDDHAALQAAAVAAARAADSAILFLGLPDAAESEGFDRSDIELPADQIALVRAVAAVQPRVVIVLAHGGVVRLAGIEAEVAAILDGGLLGQGGGHALARIIFGDAAPTGRLSETVPVRLQDVPAYLNFTPVDAHVLYGEGIYVGYRWYDARGIDVTYPFGHGLTYTTFEYSDLAVTATADELVVEVNVTNTGTRTGREVVQVYTAHTDPAVPRPLRELTGYDAVVLEPGETARAIIRVDVQDLAYWETRTDGWRVQSGRYRVDVGSSSRHIRASGSVELRRDEPKIPLTLDSTIGELMADPAAADVFGELLAAFGADDSAGETLGMDMAKMIGSMPISKLAAFSGGALDEQSLLSSLALINSGGRAVPVA